ncbi:hypothetical protein pb186bvf_010701 [Paramecium bursaria]
MNFLIRSTSKIPRFWYFNEKSIDLRNEKSSYFMNPEEVARRFIKLLALHNEIKKPDQITLASTWHDIGLSEMGYVEVMIEAEREFAFEIPDEDLEGFRNVKDAVEYIARSFFTA